MDRADVAGERPWVIYHSHTRGPAYPSRSDIEFGHDPQVVHVILAVHDPVDTDVRAYRIVQGQVTLVQLVVED